MLLADFAPTTAERIRSICARPGGALLAVEAAEPITTPIHHLLDDGSFAVMVPASFVDPSRIGGDQAVLELADYASPHLRAPVRSLVWIRGPLEQVPLALVPEMRNVIAAENPNPALMGVETPNSGSSGAPNVQGTRYRLLRLQTASVVVADASGAESVDVEALLAARPDPFTAMEACWLQHLDTAHGVVVERLASRLPAALRRGRVRLLGLDRYGVRLRVECDEGDHDVRLPFHQPVDDVTGLNQAIRVLMGCPFANGLRARRS